MSFKQFFIFLSFSILLIASFKPPTALAEPVTGEGSMRIDTMTRFVWRGLRLTDDGPVVQPSFDATLLGIGPESFDFHFGIWGNYDTDFDEYTRVDHEISFTGDISNVRVGAGYIYYSLKQGKDTQEVFVSLGYETFLNPTAKIYFDFDEGDGVYVEGIIDHEIEFSEETAFSFGLTLGVNIENELLGLDKRDDPFTAFYSGSSFMALALKPHPNFLIEPIIKYDFPLTEEAEDHIEAMSYDNKSETVYGGVGIALVF